MNTVSPMSTPFWINAKRKEGERYRCEEASMFMNSTPTMFMPCGATATHKMWAEKDGNYYWMCDACAHHNTRRGMVEVAGEA